MELYEYLCPLDVVSRRACLLLNYFDELSDQLWKLLQEIDVWFVFTDLITDPYHNLILGDDIN